jgi:hypothetical protein
MSDGAYEGQVVLASKGKFYGDQVPEGVVNCNAWDATIEKKLLSRSVPFNQSLDYLLKTCTDLKLDPADLILADRSQLLFYIRCLSVGTGYRFDFQCKNCDKKSVVTDVDLERDLSVDYVTDDTIEPFECALPVSGKTIRWRLLRGRDERATDKYVTRMRSRGIKDEDGTFHRMASRVVSIGDNPITENNFLEALNFVSKLKGKDNLAFIQAIESIEIGVNPEITRDCTHCGYPNELMLPVDKSFFRPIARVAAETD